MTTIPAAVQVDRKGAEFATRFVGVVSAAAILVTAAAQCRADLPSGYYVLSVGVGKYRDSSTVPELKGAVNDAKRVSELFQSQGRSVRTQLLLDEQATEEAICDALEILPKQVLPGDFVFVYLSGHGTRRAGEWSFVAHDYNPHHGTVDPSGWQTAVRNRNGAISGSLFYRYLHRLCMRGHNVLLAVDSCFAGQMAEWAAVSRLGIKDDPIDLDRSPGDLPVAQQGGFIVLASSIPSQQSLDGVDNSLFTKGLLEALGGGADWDHDGEVSLKEVKHFLAWRIKVLTYRLPKLPGMNWPEQFCLCLSSFSLPESITLTSAEKAKPLFPETSINSPAYDRCLDAFRRTPKRDDLIGLWQIVAPVTDNDGAPVIGDDGKPRLAEYSLLLRPDGIYVAHHVDAFGRQDATAGRYQFYNWKQLELNSYDYFFSLEYENGYDNLKIEEFTDDAMSISVYPNPSIDIEFDVEAYFRNPRGGFPGKPVGTYVLKRVKQDGVLP